MTLNKMLLDVWLAKCEMECARMFGVSDEQYSRAIAHDFHFRYMGSARGRIQFRGPPQTIPKYGDSFDHLVVKAMYADTLREIECWRMFGVRVEWFMDELTIHAP